MALGISIARETFHLVGIDCSKTVRIDEAHPLSLPTEPEKHAEAIVDQIVPIVKKLTDRKAGVRSVVSIGIALPGMVDTRRGVWLLGLQLAGIDHIHLARMFEQRLGTPVFVEDASRTMTMLEMYKPKGSRRRDFLLLYIGLGLGSGIVINRRLYRGYHGLAGEIGHVEHAENSYRCSCNSVGCLETVVSTEGIIRMFRDRLREGVRSSLQKNLVDGQLCLSLEDILAAAETGDWVTQSILGEIGTFLGDACATLIKLFNPQAVVISGPGSVFKKYFRAPVQQVIQQRVIPEMLVDYETVFADYQDNHEAWGAAILAMKHHLDHLYRKEQEVSS
jgi:predicted NBD/HSP70 family sugar kinase